MQPHNSLWHAGMHATTELNTNYMVQEAKQR